MDAPNISELAKHFSNEDAARELLESWRWPGGAACPKCGGADPYKLTPKATSKKPGRKGLYKCRACRKQFTVTVGTVFEDSRIPLSKWLLGLHFLASSKKGMSAHQLHRMLHISYKAAWFMAHRLRYAMASGPLFELLRGIVEVDETYIGAKHKRGTKKGRPGPESHKTPVVALVERGGKVRAMPMRVTGENLKAAMTKHIHPSASLMTDEFPVYRNIGTLFESHETVHHRSGEYVRGNASTNVAEGFFSLLKRGINGSSHHVSKGHLHRYVSEFEFRYNTRVALGYNDGDHTKLIVRGSEGKRLTYKMPAGVSEN